MGKEIAPDQRELGSWQAEETIPILHALAFCNVPCNVAAKLILQSLVIGKLYQLLSVHMKHQEGPKTC